MSYTFSKVLTDDFDNIISKVTEELKKEGFGVLTQIDIKDTFQKKLNIDFRRYTILGACNPEFAYKAILAEDNIGTMLPCNVLIQEKEHGKIEVSAIDPIASMIAVQNQSLGGLAVEVSAKLKNVINNL